MLPTIDHAGSSPERRAPERCDSLLSLRRLLDVARRDGGLEAVAVADDTGCLVAGAGQWQVCEELAAAAPLLPANDTVPTRLDLLSGRLQVRRLTVDGVMVLLCSRGGGEGSDRALGWAADGCSRILRGRGTRA